MRIYTCDIEYLQTGNTVSGEYVGEKRTKSILVRAKDVLSAHEKASHYIEKGEVKKVLEVFSVEFTGEIDRD